jgi:hypothetical protein
MRWRGVSPEFRERRLHSRKRSLRADYANLLHGMKDGQQRALSEKPRLRPAGQFRIVGYEQFQTSSSRTMPFPGNY